MNSVSHFSLRHSVPDHTMTVVPSPLLHRVAAAREHRVDRIPKPDLTAARGDSGHHVGRSSTCAT